MKDHFFDQELLAQRACTYVETKIKNPNQKPKQVLESIIQEQRKNKTQLHFSVFALMATLPYSVSSTQQNRIVRLLAEKLAQFTSDDSDYHVWHFVLMRGQVRLMQGLYLPEVYAMCWTLKYVMGIHEECEIPALKTHLKVLIEQGIDFFFNRDFYETLHPHKVA